MNIKVCCMMFSFLVHCGIACAAVTPMDTQIQDEKVATIECEYQMTEKDLNKFNDNLPAKGTYHYKVYLPPGYNADKDTAYPCIFVTSPGGNASLGNLTEISQKEKFIVLMLVESKNGPNEPNMGNFLAAHDDAVKRFRIQEGLKIATGFSGGARDSSTNGGMRPGFCGIILQGAGFSQHTEGPKKGYYFVESLERRKDLAVYAIFGKNDSNISEIPRIRSAFPSYTEMETDIFDGGHEWAPAECMKRGVAWIFTRALNSEAVRKNKPLAIQMLKRNLARLQDTKSDFQKFELLSTIDTLVKLHKLSAEPDLKDNIADVQKQLQELKGSRTVQVELEAQKAFNTLSDTEGKKREKLAKDNNVSKTNKELSSLIDSYRKLSEKYKGTEYGKKAEDKAKSLESEVSPQKK